MMPEILTFSDARTGDTCKRVLHPSGLEIRVAEMPQFSVGYAMFGVRFGSVHRKYRTGSSPDILEFPAGTAHFTEHELFEKEDGDIMTHFDRLGAVGNAYTDFDRTVYHFHTQQHFDEALTLLLELVQKPYFSAENVARERSVIRQEIAECADDPEDRVFQQMLSGLYQVLPLHCDVLGTEESIAQITPEMLYDCHRHFYNLHNAVLCCAGNVSTERILAIADRCLTPAPPMTAQVICGQEPPQPAHRILRSRMSVGKPLFTIGFKSEPVFGEALLRESLLASLVMEMLCGAVSPLYQRLLAAGLINGCFTADCFAGEGWFTVTADGESDDPEAVLRALNAEIAHAKADGLDRGLFEILLRSAYGDTVIGMNSPEDCCNALLDSYMWGGLSPYARAEMLAGLTLADAQRCLETRLCSDRVCLSVIS